MAEVRPFRGLRYAPGIVGDVGQVICPPYDVIDPAQQAALYARSPYNAVRLEFGAAEPGDDESTNVYTRSAEWLRSWQRSGALERAARPTFYLMDEAYEAGGTPRRRRCLLAAVRLEPFDGGAVLPHEFTRPGPKEDRLRLMQACAANFSPLMALYRDPGGVVGLLESEAGARPPDVAAQSEGIAYRLWALDDPSTVRELQGLLAPLPLYMADGHHRYETSLVYRELRRSGLARSDAGHDYVLMGIIELSDPGLDLLGYHRLVCGLSSEEAEGMRSRMRELFVEAPGPESGGVPALEALLRTLDAGDKARPSYGLVDAASGRLSTLVLRQDVAADRLPDAAVPSLRQCDTWLLHEALLKPALGSGLEQVSYAHDLGEVARRTATGECGLAFLLRPMDLDVFEAVVLGGERLPPKSTFFMPKLPSGLVFHLLDGEL